MSLAGAVDQVLNWVFINNTSFARENEEHVVFILVTT